MPIKQIDYIQKFRDSSLETDAVGIRPGSAYSYCAATPADARVVAWADIDDVHFCKFEDDSTIYVVQPQAEPSQAVHAVAADFPGLMGLIVACTHASVLWQAHRMTRAQFEALCAAQRPGAKQRSVLRAIGNIYHPPVIDDPYGYMQQQRARNIVRKS